MKEHMKLLGLKVKDRVTGFQGTVVSICFDLYGCVQAVVMPDAKGDKLEDGRWFDTKRLEITMYAPVMPVPSFDAAPEKVPGPERKPALPQSPVR